MGRGTVAEGVQQEAELGAGLLLADADGAEHAALGFRVVDADAAAAHLEAVEHQVVGHGTTAAGVGVQEIQVLRMRAGEGVVAGHVPTALPIVISAPLQQGEVHDPEEGELGFVQHPELAGQAQAQLAQHPAGLGVRAHREDGQSFARGAEVVLQGRFRALVEELLEAAGEAVLAPLGVGQAAGAHLLGHVLQFVQLLAAAATRRLAREEQGPHPALALAFGGGAEEVELAGGEEAGDVLDLHPAAEVGLVGAVPLHGVPVGQAGEGRGHVLADHLGQLHHQRLDHALHILLPHEAHLDVDLGELRLAVGAQVLVAEAAADLDVALEAAHLEQLLEELGALGQRVELAGVDAAGHQVVAGALRCGLGEDGRLDLDELHSRK